MGQSIQNGPSEICGRQPLKNFIWFILEYVVPYEPGTLTFLFSTPKQVSLLGKDFHVLNAPPYVF